MNDEDQDQPIIDQSDEVTLHAPVSAHGESLAIGNRFGQFRILGVLGAGGMGIVYRAEQEQPNRDVALKVIRPGAVTERLLRRFSQEVEVLGRLKHPGIAQIYDAGVDQVTGFPYFAMELIVGEELTRFARRHSLNVRQRLTLFARVCAAVQHAHQKGIIHRDLKPANILVTESRTNDKQDDAQPVVLDFGVARATDADVQTATLQTEIGQLVGTVPYMSPEQVTGDPQELDTRSDVYALGVILFELLADQLPYKLEDRLIHEAVRIIREDAPTRLSNIDTKFRGDVETIVNKALEKERERRYQSAADLAGDIEHYLHDEPITARPPSTWYQFTRFARRNRALVGGMAATFVVLVAGAITSTVFAIHAENRRVEAQGLLVRAKNAEADAEKRADDLEVVADFQSSQLADLDTQLMGIRLRQSLVEERRRLLERQNRDINAIEVDLADLQQQLAGVNFTNIALRSLDENIFHRAIDAIESDFGDQPLVKARLLQTVAQTLRDLGLLEQAEAPQLEALQIRREILGENDPATLVSIDNMASLLEMRGDLEEAESHFRLALDGFRRVRGDDHTSTFNALNNMAFIIGRRGRSDEAEPYAREALDGFRRVSGEDDPRTFSPANNLGNVLREQGKLDEAETLFRDNLERRRRVLGDSHPQTLISMNNLGYVLQAQGRLEEAEAIFRESLVGSRKTLGDDHFSTFTAITNVAHMLYSLGRVAESESLFREALESNRRVFGNDDTRTIDSVVSLGVLIRVLERYDEAEPFYREALEARRRVLGQDHPDTMTAAYNLASLLRLQGEYAEAAPLIDHCYQVRLALYGNDHDETQRAVRLQVRLHDSWHQAEPGTGHDVIAAEWRTKLVPPSSDQP